MDWIKLAFDGALKRRHWALLPYEKWTVSWPAKSLYVSEQGVCSMHKSVSLICVYIWSAHFTAHFHAWMFRFYPDVTQRMDGVFLSLFILVYKHLWFRDRQISRWLSEDKALPHRTITFFFPFWGNSPPPHQWVRVPSFTRFQDHTQRRTTFGRTPLDEWSARRRDLYLKTHNTHNRHPCPRWDSNPQSQQASGHRPTPWTARPLGPTL